MIQLRINKERRLILIAGAVLLFLGLIYRSPFFEELTSGAEIDDKIQRIAKYQSRIPQKEALEQKRRELTRRVEELQKVLLKGNTPALSAVNMQNRLTDIAGSLGMEIKSTSVLKPVPIKNTDLISIAVQFTAELTVKQLKQLLYQIELSDHQLQVKGLQLRKTSGAPVFQLQATITMEGYMLKPAGEV